MARQQYENKRNPDSQAVLDGFNADADKTSLDRELALCRAMLAEAYATGDRIASVALMATLARLSREADRMDIRSLCMMSKRQCEELIDEIIKITVRHISDLPNWQDRMRAIGKEIMEKLGESKPTETERRNMLRLTDARPGSKTGVTE
jgi:hypothetical protein